MPAVLNLDTRIDGADDSALYRQMARDCLWADPASEAMEDTLEKDGFGPSLRGGGTICFGNRAIESFLGRHNFSYIVRAHEACSEGVGLSKTAQVLTVFSTSKDHGMGEVCHEKIVVTL